jgi:HemK-like putative methylase
MQRIKDYLTKNLHDEESVHIGLNKFINYNEPISKILCFKPFWQWDFITNCDTLDPRPETEFIIEQIMKKYNKYEKLRFIDMGVGTGCILLSLLKLYPLSFGVGIDISTDALRIAKINTQRLQLCHRVKFIQSNWWMDVNGYFDILVSNPPYLSDISGNLIYDPAISLLGNENTYEAIIRNKNFKEAYLEIPENLYPKLDLSVYKYSYKDGILNLLNN